MEQENTDLHTKHRPTTFDEVIGQDAVVKSLKAVLKKHTSHAFIFCGPPGTGKTTLARVVASEVGASSRNIIEIDAATYTGVDSMRDVTKSLMFSPLGKSKAKMIIVDECHRLSAQAFSSLLKSTEEPPPHVYWALCTTEELRIPKAMRRRFVQYKLDEVDEELIRDMLADISNKERLDTSEEVLDFIAQHSDGSPGVALPMLAQCAGCTSRKEAAKLIRAVQEEGEAVDLCRALSQGVDWQRAMKIVAKLEGTNPESIRMVVVNYFTKAALGAKTDRIAQKQCAVLDAFREPYGPGNSLSPVILSLGQLLL